MVSLALLEVLKRFGIGVDKGVSRAGSGGFKHSNGDNIKALNQRRLHMPNRTDWTDNQGA
jgi:hypothetical protein